MKRPAVRKHPGQWIGDAVESPTEVESTTESEERKGDARVGELRVIKEAEEELTAETLRQELNRIRARYFIANHITPADAELEELFWFLRAAFDPNFAERRKKFVGAYRHMVERTNGGPRARWQEVDGLCARLERDASAGLSANELAESGIRALRIYRLLRADTCVPANAAPWPDTEREQVTTAAARELQRAIDSSRKPGGEKLTRAFLRGVGYKKRADNLFGYRVKRDVPRP